MNISIRHIQHFIVVAEELHFRRAAQLSNVAQPALSRSVQTLENELGVQLLARNNRNVKLTPAGKEFLAGCTGIVTAMESTIHKTIRTDQSQFGSIRVGYTYIAMCGKLPQLISTFEKQDPAITIEPISCSTAEQLEQLHREEIDCCFISGAVRKFVSAEIDSKVFQTDPFIVIVSRNHPLANQGSISIEQLAKEKTLLSGQPIDSGFNQHVHQFFNEAGVEPDLVYVQQNHVGVLGLVALGRGVCIATEGYSCVYTKELTTLKLTGTQLQLPTLLAWRKDLVTERTIKFRDFVLQNASAKPPAVLTNASPLAYG